MSKLQIRNGNNEAIVGILEKKTEYDIGREKPRLAIIVHGILGHKDYLFHRTLANKLPISSFRFDFRGNGESEGLPGYCNIEEDACDIGTVARYFEKEGFEIYGLIGHSRGALSSFKYAASCERPLPIMVNLSGRFKMNDNQLNTSRPEIGKSLKEKGYFDWKVKQRDHIATVKVTVPEVEKFQNWSNEFVAKIPLSTCVLTCHGLNDTIVPPYNAAMFANRVPNHTLILMPDADHFYRGKYEEISEVVVGFFEMHERSNYSRAISMGQGSALVIPRWIDVGGVENFCDIGGWPVNNGKGYIRERVVFRTENLSKLALHERARLEELNVKAIFDFILDYEAEKEGAITDIPGITRYTCNLARNGTESPRNLYKHVPNFLNGPEDFALGCMSILESGKKLISDAFRFMATELSTQNRSAVVINCVASEGYLGLFIIVLLGLCGVEDEIIAKEYELSAIGHFNNDKSETGFRVLAQKTGTSIDEIKPVLSYSLQGILMLIKKLKEKYDSFEGYVCSACELTVREIEAIRELMVVPIQFEERQFYRGHTPQ